LINEGKKLPSWHYLLTGNFEKMEKQRKCVRNRVTSEKEIDIKKYKSILPIGRIIKCQKQCGFYLRF